MASSSNENGNLMDEFEEAFQSCLHALTKQESNTGNNKEEIDLEVQKTTNKFIDVARQMEAFFLQKRFLVSTLKPDMLIKDENLELRNEITRKEALINKHYNRLEEWKNCLSDIQQQQGYNKPPIPGQGEIRPGQQMGYMNPMPPNMPVQMGMTQNQLQQQHMQSQLQQQQKMMQAQQMQQMQQNYGKMNKSMK
ncbi:mediator of RNA polymerase II transcription subunit 28 [Episyrphus balteatus]|uniref:mediator of RNA polymerase II transcription subunit 28 n=1 Tax=Episyrphus balteatus TaxID=286459 RepID=UPI00248615E6|nr:mediator of RNA polymerase II transcription subunit 28 [Episyrphus balteatus]